MAIPYRLAAIDAVARKEGDPMESDIKRASPARWSEPAIVIGLLALLCGMLAAVMFHWSRGGATTFVLATLVAFCVMAPAYALAARCLGWRRIDFDKLFDWFHVLS